MAGLAQDFRKALETRDVDALMGLWARHFPHLPGPKTREHATICMHTARTATDTLELRHRAYSHRWLEERGLPSHLPDRLKASAERLYPTFVDGVAIGVHIRSPYFRPATPLVRQAMSDAVEDAFAEGLGQDAAFVSARMAEAKDKAFKQLFGVVVLPADK